MMQTLLPLFVISALFPIAASKFPDWLVTRIGIKSQLREYGNILELTNGLISRSFVVQDVGFATVDFYSHEKKSSLIRAIQPEAQVSINDIEYNVGGFMTGNMTRAYLNRTALKEHAVSDHNAFEYVSHKIGPITPRQAFYKRIRDFLRLSFH